MRTRPSGGSGASCRGALRALRLAAGVIAVTAAAAPGVRGARAEERIRVRLDGSGAVEDLRLEDYVAGVVAGEMPASFPAEAQKAQAVAARSYALTRKLDAQVAGRAWDIGAGVLSRCTGGRAAPWRGPPPRPPPGRCWSWGWRRWRPTSTPSAAARPSRGSRRWARTCPTWSRSTAAAARTPPARAGAWVLGAGELGRLAGLGGPVDAVRVVARTATGRAERVELARGERVASLAAADLRQRLGFSRLQSLAFEVTLRQAQGERTFVFDGRGQGHGAGMCQWGAAAMARDGKTYREILAHYYPGTDVVRMY